MNFEWDDAKAKSNLEKPGISFDVARFQGKTQEMVVLEPDAVDFFRATGEMSAGRINAVLREYVEQQRKRA